MSNKFQEWISSELKEIKKNNLHRTLTEIDSSMSVSYTHLTLPTSDLV